jgi:hypothetical protein
LDVLLSRFIWPPFTIAGEAFPGVETLSHTQIVGGKGRKRTVTIIVWKASLDGANKIPVESLCFVLRTCVRGIEILLQTHLLVPMSNRDGGK